MTELTLSVGPPANGGSCVARHDGRVVFVRYALPGETVRARIIEEKDAYWHAEALEILEPSPDRIASLCPIAGPGGAGCCDLAFVDPEAARILKGQVVLNQLDRIAGYQPERELEVEPMGTGEATGWRTRVRMGVGPGGSAGFRRYHSGDLVAAEQCGQLVPGLLHGLQERHPSVGTVRSIGLFGVFELVRSRDTMEPMAPFNGSSPEMAALDARLRDDGLYTMLHWNQVFTNPPLCITEEQLREGFAVIDRALEATDAAIA